MRAPRYQPNQIAPARTTRARFVAANNGGGVSGGIARGLQVTGQALGNAAQVQMRIEEERADAESRASVVDFQARADELLLEVQEATGLDAAEAVEKAQGKLSELASGFAGEASSLRAQRLISERIKPYEANFNSRLQRHSVEQARVARESAFKAQVDMTRDQAIKAAADEPNLAEQHIATGLSLLEAEAGRAGRGPQEFELAAGQFRSSVRRGQIASLIADGDLDTAIAVHDAHGDELTAEDEISVSSALLQVRQGRAAEENAGWALAQASQMPLSVAGGSGEASITLKDAVPGGNVTSPFGMRRNPFTGEASSHSGVDIAAPVGTPIKAIAKGTVTSVSSDPRSGNFVIVDYGNGLTQSYSHLQGADVEVGDTVEAGQSVGRIGMTGRTTGPHVHITARLHGKRIDPLSDQARPTASAAQPQMLEAALSALDRRQNLSFEDRERAKARLKAMVGEQDALRARSEREADREASELVLGLGEQFKSMEMLPDELRQRMSPASLMRHSEVVKRNNAQTNPSANSDTAISLTLMKFYEPERFAAHDLSQHLGAITRGELEGLLVDQAKLRNQSAKRDVEWSPRTGILSALSFEKRLHPELDLEPADEAIIMQMMESRARSAFAQNGGKPLTEDEYRALFGEVTREIRTSNQFLGFEYGKGSVRLFEMDSGNIPAPQRSEIEARLRASGLPVTDENILRLYRSSL